MQLSSTDKMGRKNILSCWGGGGVLVFVFFYEIHHFNEDKLKREDKMENSGRERS